MGQKSSRVSVHGPENAMSVALQQLVKVAGTRGRRWRKTGLCREPWGSPMFSSGRFAADRNANSKLSTKVGII